jgi:integrase
LEAVLGKAIDVVGWRRIELYRWKTGNSSMLTMTGRLREVMLRRYAERGNSAHVFPGYTDDGEDTPRSRNTGAIRGAIGRAGCNSNPAQVKREGRATHHTFRGTFASWLVQRGMSLFKVQQLLGHSSPAMTQNTPSSRGFGRGRGGVILDQLAIVL